MVAVGMRQHDVFEDRVRAEMLFQMRNDLIASFGMAAVDQHQLISVDVAISDDNGVAGLGTLAYGQEFNFAFQPLALRPGSLAPTYDGASQRQGLV